MTQRYATPAAFKQAVEHRLREAAAGGGSELARVRQRLVFDRFLARVVNVFGDRVTGETPCLHDAERSAEHARQGLAGSRSARFGRRHRRQEAAKRYRRDLRPPRNASDPLDHTTTAFRLGAGLRAHGKKRRPALVQSRRARGGGSGVSGSDPLRRLRPLGAKRLGVDQRGGPLRRGTLNHRIRTVRPFVPYADAIRSRLGAFCTSAVEVGPVYGSSPNSVRRINSASCCSGNGESSNTTGASRPAKRS